MPWTGQVRREGDALIINSSAYMQTRMLEMGLAALMVTCGITLLWPGETFASPIYAILIRWMTEAQGGWFLLSVGFLRSVALIINGRWRSSPIARIAGCLTGCGFWFTFAVSVGTVDRGDITGWPILLPISGTLFLLEFFSAMRCGTDAEALDSLRLRQARSKVPDSA
jgi:hypothetical protein